MEKKKPVTAFTSSNVKLLKIAAIGGVIVCSAGYLFKTLIERKFKKTEFYEKAIEHVLAHKALVKYLGEPITFGSVDISKAGKNYTTEKEASCEIGIYGSKYRGTMQFTAIRRAMPAQQMNEKNSQPESTGASNIAASTKYEPDCEYCQPSVKLSPWEIKRIEVSVNNRPNERVIVPTGFVNS